MTRNEIDDILIQLGAEIEAARRRRRPKLSQRALAQAAGLPSHAIVTRVENGLPTNTDSLVALADVLDLEIVLRPRGTQTVRLELPPEAIITSSSPDPEAA